MAPITRSEARADDWSDFEDDGDYLGGFSRSNSEARSTRNDDHHGKFIDLKNFMDFEATDQQALEYKTIGNLERRPGHIIHVDDEYNSAIDGRVLLILQPPSQGMKCLGFCLQYPIPICDHWRVYKRGNAPRKGQIIDPSSLEVHLIPFPKMTRNEAYAPQHGITLNLRDTLNMETISQTTRAVYLGRVRTECLQRVSVKVKDIFCSDLDKAIPPATGSQAKRKVKGASHVVDVERQQSPTQVPAYGSESEVPGADVSKKKQRSGEKQKSGCFIRYKERR